MEKYKNLIIKTIIIVILIVIAVLLSRKQVFIPEDDLPINSYYTEDEMDYEELYIEKTLNNFIKYLEKKDYYSAYNLLTQDCKDKKFKEEVDFENYLQENYPEYVEFESDETLFFTFYDYSEFDSMKSTKEFVILIGKQKDGESIYTENDIPSIKITLVVNGPYDMKIEM